MIFPHIVFAVISYGFVVIIKNVSDDNDAFVIIIVNLCYTIIIVLPVTVS